MGSILLLGKKSQPDGICYLVRLLITEYLGVWISSPGHSSKPVIKK